MNFVKSGTLSYPLRIGAALYSGVSRIRNQLYDAGWITSYTSSLPVISVGNLTVGGNGKTPLVITIVEQLKERGHRPVVLSRGYGGSMTGPHLVTKNDRAEQVGDEPLLISLKTGVPVVVARKRAAGAELIEKSSYGDVIVLDDGFQHRALNRCCNIVCIRIDDVEAIQEFLRGELLPHGRFREPLREGIKRADTIMLVNRSAGTHPPPSVEEDLARVFPPSTTVFRSHIDVRSVQSILDEEVLKPQSVVAVSGIANPRAFHRSLETAGFRVLDKREFADHHTFSREDIESIRTQYPGTAIVCTEKDSVKLREISGVGAIFELRMRAAIKPSDAFMVHLERAIARARASSV